MSEKNKLEKFNPEKYDMLTQLIAADWSTKVDIFLYRLMYFATKKGNGMYSQRGIATMLDVSKSTVNRSLRTLEEKGFMSRAGGRYYRAVLAGKIEVEIGEDCTNLPDLFEGVPGGECPVIVGQAVPIPATECTNLNVHNTEYLIRNINKGYIAEGVEVEEENSDKKELTTTTYLPTKETTKPPTEETTDTKTTCQKNSAKKGRDKIDFTGCLPPDKLQRFLNEGKIEIDTNVYMHEAEYNRLIKEFGEPATCAGIASCREWSMDEDPAYNNPKLKKYETYHQKVDHYRTVRKCIQRNQNDWGKVAVQTKFGGYEFQYASKEQ